MRDREFVNKLDIATPCDRTWDSLVGDERKRYCGECKLHVFNFSAMTPREARRVLSGAEGRVCGRFLRRADGTVITRDCGPVREGLRRRVRRLRVAAAALFGLVFTFASGGCGPSGAGGSGGVASPAAGSGGPATDPGGEIPELLGEVCVPEDAPTPHEEPIREELGDIIAPEELVGRIAVPSHDKPAEAPPPTPPSEK